MDDLEYGFIAKDSDSDRRSLTWTLKGPKGAIHIWAQFSPTLGHGDRCYGGVECHFLHKRFDFQPDEAPIEKCWLHGGPCWPDGSSLYFEERIKHMVEAYEDKPERLQSFIHAELLDWYRAQFDKDAAE